MTTHRERFFALTRDKEPLVFSWIMGFFNDRVAKRLLGEGNVPQDCLPTPEWHFGASDRLDWEAKIRYTTATGNCAVAVGWGANIAFGHGQPGEFAERLLERGEDYRLSEYETGVKKEVRYKPYFYHHFAYPIQEHGDLERLRLPDPDDPARYRGLAEEIAYYKAHDLVTCASVNGFFSGIHYFLYPYESLLADLLLEPDFVQELLARLGPFNLRAAERLLQCGVDMITFCDDLGSGTALLMRPELYREFFLPWHARLAELCHRYGALLHMHSHGNINQIVGDLYEAGIDLLNPNDPQEGMNLPALKRRYGARITFVGGLDKFFFQWSAAQQEAYVERLVREAGGGMILMDSGGVPEDMTPERFRQLRTLFERIKGEWGGV